MKVTVTHLKAPWPDGTKVGEVVELEGDTLPPQFVGKCIPGSSAASAEAKVDELANAQAMLAEAKAEADELRAMVEKLTAERDALKAELAAKPKTK